MAIKSANAPPKIIGIVGPTASGKTGIALGLAREFNGEIISCDSVQIFKHLDICSAKPSQSETGKIKYHLIDLIEPDCRIDAGMYKSLAESKILEVLASGQTPIVAGGTGMYFNSLYYGLFSGPGRSDKIRDDLASRQEDSLYEELVQRDPESAGKIKSGDTRRIVRALEVYYSTGRPISELHRENKKLELNWFIIGLICDRQTLYGRIEKRVDFMIGEGLLKETEDIISKFGKEAYALSSIGYRHASNYLSGVWTYEEFVFFLKRDTRRYAKRQMTWFKKNGDIHWFDILDAEGIKGAVRGFL
jgi:tRNA dimethylallyltransferase